MEWKGEIGLKRLTKQLATTHDSELVSVSKVS